MTPRKTPTAETILEAIQVLSGTIEHANSYLDVIADALEKVRTDVGWLIENREDVFGLLKSEKPEETIVCTGCSGTSELRASVRGGWEEITFDGENICGLCPTCIKREDEEVIVRPLITEPPLEQRSDDHEKWKVEVRDPARESSEGLRELRVPGAEANYEIGRTKSGKWAVTLHASYTKGDCSGKGNPWEVYETREECVERFLQFARQHFSGTNIQDNQKDAQKAMLRLLQGGLFWQEPDPLPPSK